MKREDAFALVRKRGGTPRRGITKDTDVLIVGELGWPLLADGRPSNSLAKARSHRVPIASERRFLEWTGRRLPEEQARTYTGEQIVSLSKLPKEIIEQLTIFGLIESRDGRYGFRDLAAARQIAGLLASGIVLSVITRSLHEIRKWLPDARLSSLRMFPESSDRVLIKQMKGHTDRSGQFVLPIEPEEEMPDLLFDQAQAAEHAKDRERAERLYRRILKMDGRDSAAAYNLGNLMRVAGRLVEAEAAYRAAVAADAACAEAWYNLADVLDDQTRTADAVSCLERALEADPSYADAMFNLALLLQKLEQPAQAAIWWRKYLELDSSSQWAVRAKRALKYCEIQIVSSS
jgi:tetratricopeptide (TPR) repeat protein